MLDEKAKPGALTADRDARMRPEDHLLALVGPWVLNKGDDLMFRSVLRHFDGIRIGGPAHLWPAGVPDELVTLLSNPTRDEVRRDALRPDRLLRLAARRTVLALPPRRSIALSGRANLREATAVLDCSGFGYGDDWTVPRMIARRETYAMLKARGAPIAVLPQALGPFERPDMRQAARDLFSLADLIFARDSDSHGFVRSLDLGPGVRLRQAPDITHLLQGDVPPDAAAWSDAVCIVPNTRMLDKTGPERSAAYLDFLQDAVAATRAHGLRPVVVLHEANDGDTIGRLNDRLEAPVEVVDEDAVRTKGIFASCHAVVASRYHALVSCLSQATPCIGTSWSHKYDRLFEEYDHSDFLLIPEGDPIERRARLDALLDPEGRAAIAARLAPHARAQKDKVAGMWSEIDDLLGIDHVRAEGGG